ncbi:MAG: putative Ig domain-containing protein, partial [Candidatus Omnitrophica bacterium]|nr:putative Ig domain-containing protein [Candidatus Omnitrophota bacterium]
MFKKILVLLALMFVLFMPKQAMAANVTIAAGNTSGNPGDAVIVPLAMSQLALADGAISFDGELLYDSGKFTYTGYDTSGAISGQANYMPIINGNTAGKIVIAIFNPYGISGSGTLISFKFTINAQAASGVSTLTLNKAVLSGGSNTVTKQNGSITVLGQANRAPVLDSIGNKQVAEGATLMFNISASDLDNDTLAYSATNLPTNASFNTSTKAFSFSPSYTQAGTYSNVHFEVSDGRGGADSEDIAITVTNTNRAPVLASIGAQSVNEGQTLSITLAASDADNDTLTYSASNLPQGATLSAATFSWTPSYSQAGSYQVTFGVSDGNGGSDSETVTLTVNNVARTFTLTTTANNGSISRNPNSSTYNEGQSVVLTAVANSGYTFSSWSGGLTGSVNPQTITMDNDKTVTANFSQNTYTLNITANNGTVAKSPDQATYTYGTEVTLTCTANAGYSFTNWTGDATGSTNPVKVTINGNKAVTANFSQNTYTLNITANNGTVAKSPDLAVYPYGTEVTLTATANTGYSFSNWTVD